MERDVLANARAEKERLVREFYSEVVVQINELIRDVSSNVLESLDEHQGIIRGPVSSQLRNLIGQLERLNFINDAGLMRQIERIQSVLHSQADGDQELNDLARMGTSHLRPIIH